MRLRNNPNANNILHENNDIVIEQPEDYKGKWHDVFNNDHDIYIEIGMGKGDFIFESAKRYPDINFIGIEKYPTIVAIAIEKFTERPENLRIIKYDAAQLNDVFDESEIGKIYLNFSDPWPKKRHAKRRLTYSSFLEVYETILKDDGNIEFKTDNRGLFEYSIVSMNQYLMNFELISLDLHKNEELMVDNIFTEYERKFCQNGPIYKMIANFKTKKGEE